MKKSFRSNALAVAVAVAVASAGVLLLGLPAAHALAQDAKSMSSIAETQPQSSATETVGDSWITTKVKAELRATKGVDGNAVSVDTKDGVVTLTGVLPTHTEVKKATAAAKSINGVKNVDTAGLKTKN